MSSSAGEAGCLRVHQLVVHARYACAGYNKLLQTILTLKHTCIILLFTFTMASGSFTITPQTITNLPLHNLAWVWSLITCFLLGII